MLALRIESEMEKTLDAVAKSLGKNRSEVVRETLVRYFEDLEDAERAEASLRDLAGTKSLAEVRRDLGLDN